MVPLLAISVHAENMLDIGSRQYRVVNVAGKVSVSEAARPSNVLIPPLTGGRFVIFHDRPNEGTASIRTLEDNVILDYSFDRNYPAFSARYATGSFSNTGASRRVPFSDGNGSPDYYLRYGNGQGASELHCVTRQDYLDARSSVDRSISFVASALSEQLLRRFLIGQMTRLEYAPTFEDWISVPISGYFTHRFGFLPSNFKDGNVRVRRLNYLNGSAGSQVLLEEGEVEWSNYVAGSKTITSGVTERFNEISYQSVSSQFGGGPNGKDITISIPSFDGYFGLVRGGIFNATVSGQLVMRAERISPTQIRIFDVRTKLEVNDLFDFDYFDNINLLTLYLPRAGASVQAGYGLLGNVTGEVFMVRAELQKQIPSLSRVVQ